MDIINNAKWIKAARYKPGQAYDFIRKFSAKDVVSAKVQVTSHGVYDLSVNGRKVGGYVLAPGWTDYDNRLQYQTYDVTGLLKNENTVTVSAGTGWFFRKWTKQYPGMLHSNEIAVIAAIELVHADGAKEYIFTDESWKCRRNEIVYNDIYNGEKVDFTKSGKAARPVKVIDFTKDCLIPQEGEEITEHERFPAQRMYITPKGETVVDFGQEVTGYVELHVNGKPGEQITLKHFEMPDAKGCVYTANYRFAKAEFTVICDGKEHTVKPRFTFYGFRYVQIIGGELKPEDLTAVTVHSEMTRTGRFECSDEMINKLYHNIIWGQKGNFLDVPTDCPQRDERLGWTGDAQVFCKTASYNFNTEKFFAKWLADVRSVQRADGEIPNFIPCSKRENGGSAAWADVAVIVPWQMYLTYGHKKVLEDNFDMMRQWIEYMRSAAKNKQSGKFFRGNRNEFLHNDHWHFGDWLALDLPDKEAVGGATDKSLIATAFFAYSTSLFIKAGKVLGKDMSEYETLYENVRKAFNEEYVRPDGSLTSDTQTAAVLALHFDLTDRRDGAAKQLVRLIRECGHLTTGFVGTPYLLHVLSDIGETGLAYDLLLRKEFPSWCYPITMGATTMWERWNGLKPDGSFATKHMNSFNHYAYGAVGDWLYEHMCGIHTVEDGAGFGKILFAPETDERFRYACASVDTAHGTVASRWDKTENGCTYTFTVPENTAATARINGKIYTLHTGLNKIEG